jgi:hypothetical protein
VGGRRGAGPRARGLRPLAGARVRGRRPQRRSSKPREAAFVELGPALPLGPVSPAGPVVELTGADGQKLTLRLAGPDELDLPGLVREFWSREA